MRTKIIRNDVVIYADKINLILSLFYYTFSSRLIGVLISLNFEPYKNNINNSSHDDLDFVIKTILSLEERNYFLIQDAIEEALQICVENDYPREGLQLVDALLEIAPYNSEYWYHKGTFLNNIFKFEEAYDCLDKALSLNPNDSDILITKSIAADNLGLKSEAFSALEKALALDPNNDEALFNMAVFYERNSDFETAILFFLKTIEVDSEYAEAWYELGFCYDILGKNTEAIEAYNRFVELEPFAANGWYNRGIVLIKESDYSAAAQDFELAASLKDNFASAWYNAGVAYLTLKNYKKALKSFLNAAEIDTLDESVWYNIGFAYEMLDELKNAILAYDKAIEIDDGYFEAFLSRGYCYFAIDKKELAIKDLGNAFMLYNPTWETSKSKINNFSEELKNDLAESDSNIFETIELCKNLIEQEPANIDYMLLLSEQLIMNENFSEAKEVLNNVLKINADTPKAIYLKAKVEFILGNILEALEALKVAFSLKPNLKAKFADDFPEINSSKLFNTLIDRK